MIRTAVILAAGMGMRINGSIGDIPKGFINVGGETLIERSIRKLREFGIETIVIVVGYRAEYYEELAERHHGIVLLKNKEYENSGSMYSYYCAGDNIETGFLLLESDLIYEDRAIQVLLDSGKEDVVLMSGSTYAGDEVFVETNNNTLVDMSKDRTTLGSVDGELVGISKISLGLHREMIRTAERMFETTLHVDYESCIVEASKQYPVHTLKIVDLIWGEIDDEHHLKRIHNKVYPKLYLIEQMIPRK